jgi:translation elongation factor EF-1beta
MDNFYPKRDEVNIKTMEKRVNSYLQTDTVS